MVTAISFILLSFLCLSIIHSIVTPFLLAAILAYLLNPLVKFLTQLKVPRTIAVVSIYILVIAILFLVTTQLGFLLAEESRDLNRELRHLQKTTEMELVTAPPWIKESITSMIKNFDIGTFISPTRLWPYFSGAISRIGTLFIFLVATFYFLKDGQHVLSKFLPKEVMNQVYIVMNNYLRGQVFLVILMSTVSWLALSLLQVKYALILGIFTGIAEIVPIIGPITAGVVAILVAMFDGVSSFSLPPLFEGLMVAGIYFIFRQIEDVFIIPLVLGKATKLHPLLVLFAVLVGGHVWGVLGMILAVPVAALLRVILEYINA